MILSWFLESHITVAFSIKSIVSLPEKRWQLLSSPSFLVPFAFVSIFFTFSLLAKCGHWFSFFDRSGSGMYNKGIISTSLSMAAESSFKKKLDSKYPGVRMKRSASHLQFVTTWWLRPWFYPYVPIISRLGLETGIKFNIALTALPNFIGITTKSIIILWI